MTYPVVLQYNQKNLATTDLAYLEDVRHKKNEQEDLVESTAIPS